MTRALPLRAEHARTLKGLTQRNEALAESNRRLRRAAEEARQLLGRLREFEADNLSDDCFHDWNGFVAPALARLELLLREASAPPAPCPGGGHDGKQIDLEELLR